MAPKQAKLQIFTYFIYSGNKYWKPAKNNLIWIVLWSSYDSIF